MKRLGPVVWVAGVAIGLVSESLAFHWGEPWEWMPDLVVGLVFIGAGVKVWTSERGPGVLLVTTGYLWFFGNLVPAGLYLYLGTLIHLLVAYPRWRPRSSVASVAVAVGYGAALIFPVWSNEAASVALSVGVAAVVSHEFVSVPGRDRQQTKVALRGTLGLAAVSIGGVVARLSFPGVSTTRITLLAYEVALVAVALGLMVGVAKPAASVVADRVIELGDVRSEPLRASLATALADLTLELGYWNQDVGAYVSDRGTEIEVVDPNGQRRATSIDRNGRRFAVLVHDASVLKDPSLIGSVGMAIRLTSSNSELRAQVQAQVDELIRSRRRLVVAADEEQRRLADRLRDGAEGRLSNLNESLRAGAARSEPAVVVHLDRAGRQLGYALDDLRQLSRGLHPRLLSGGLRPALTELAEQSGIATTLSIPEERFSPEVETAAYYTCAEAMANATKHASASLVFLEVGERDGWLRTLVIDDGVGGADPARGTGLVGLTDRIEALGGRLMVESRPGSGTRLTAEIPLGGEIP